MKSIELKNVSFSYEEGSPVLKDVNAFFNYGELALLSGPSGVGKSTFMYIASGIIPNIIEGKVEGEVYIDGENIRGKKIGDITHKVGVVLQNADEQIIYNDVEDEISFGLENLGYEPDKISKQIDLVTKLLKLDKSAKCRTLSGGQKQRLITASTLAMGQKIIILDEPLANLDKETSIDLLSTLKVLASNGYSVIIIEHRIDLVLPYVSKVYHFEDKTIKEIENKEVYLEEQSKKICTNCKDLTTDKVLFEVKNLSYKYKKTKQYILKNLNFEIFEGSRTVILGENGKGKTTLLKLLAKLLKVKEGDIITYFDDPKINKKNRGNRKWFKRVGYVYQNPDYQLFMKTVEKEMMFNAYSEEYAIKIAKYFDVYDLFDRHPTSLSEGQKRRLTIASILASRPDVLLLDEPTVGQDSKRLEDMVNALNLIHEETHNTMVVITHDYRCAEALCDRSLLLKGEDSISIGGKELIKEYFGK